MNRTGYEMTDNEILYELITKMNLDFIIRKTTKYSVYFIASDYQVLYHKDKNLFVGNNYHETESITLGKFDIDALIEHYQLGMNAKIKQLQDEINKIKNTITEQGKSRIPKAISQLIGYEYDTLVVVGGNELIYVDESYSDVEYDLADIAEKNELLKRYMLENEINQDAKIKFMKADTYKKEFKIRNF